MEHLIEPIVTGAIIAVATVGAIWKKLAAIDTKLGVIAEKVRQLEKRIEGNHATNGLPIRCMKHSTQLEDFKKRLEELEGSDSSKVPV